MRSPIPVRASVIIVGYNSRRHLEYGLAGIVASLGAQDELILVDNASSDGSADWVRQAFPSVQLVVSKANLGFGGANNLGVERACGEFVVFINPDTSVDPGWLEALLQALQDDPQVQLATSRIVLMDDPATINACGNDVHLSGITLCRGMGQPADEFALPGSVGAVSGAAFGMRRNLFLELDGYDADFFLYMEDTDLALRARLVGAQSVYVPSSIVRHAYTLRFGPSKVFYQERNRYLMLLKLYRWGTLLVLLPVFLLGEIVTWGYVLLRERSRPGNKLRAYGWVLVNWKSIMAKRRQVQRLRRIPDRELVGMMVTRLEVTQVDPGWLGRAANGVFSAFFAVLKQWSLLWIWW
ncbi:MAG: glycosyltransferase family 2 protein [Anaerolineales bacterium]|nr:glycosyltransferase family 2 protein [Anaerolineales bacterium]